MDGLRPVRDDEVGIDLLQHTQAGARRARAERAVEGEGARGQLLHGDAAVRAGEVGGEEHFALARTDIRDHDAAGERERGLQRVGQAGLDVLAQDQAVHDDLDGMLLLLGERRRLGDVNNLPVDARAHEALLGDAFEHLDVLALLAAHERRKQLHARAFGQGEHLIDHLIDALFADLPAALGAVRHAHARVEQAQVVVNLRHRADGGTGVLAGGLLVDGDGRGEAVDGIAVRLLHLPEELAGIGGQRFHIAALTLGVERVKREGGLAAAGQAGKDDELVAWQRQVKALEVVLARAADDDGILHGGTPLMMLRRKSRG